MPINITQESYDKVKQVGQGPNVMRKHKKPRLEDPLINKNPHLLGLEEPVVVSNPDPPSPEKQPKILFSGINPAKYAKVSLIFFQRRFHRIIIVVRVHNCHELNYRESGNWVARWPLVGETRLISSWQHQ